LSFIENRGQWDGGFSYKAGIPGGNLYVFQNKLLFDYYNVKDYERIHELTCGTNKKSLDEVGNEIINLHAYAVEFIGANKQTSYINENRRSYFHNYFLGNDPSKWQSKVGLFGSVIQKGLYNGIDFKIYTADGKISMKYDFVVAPGANPNQIKLKYDGVTPLLKEDGSLLIKTSVNEVSESAPYTYQIINGKKIEVASRYVLKNNELSFEFPNGYNNAFELVIDPDLIFATFSGAITSQMYSFATTYDETSCLYAGARAHGVGLPVTTGSYQINFAGGSHDVGINKYNPLGTGLIYSTYFGG